LLCLHEDPAQDSSDDSGQRATTTGWRERSDGNRLPTDIIINGCFAREAARRALARRSLALHKLRHHMHHHGDNDLSPYPGDQQVGSRARRCVLAVHDWWEDSVDGIEDYRLRACLAVAMSRWWGGYELLMDLLAVVSMVQYILQTYSLGKVVLGQLGQHFEFVLELSFAAVFFCDWSFRFFMAQHKWDFLKSFLTMVDLATCIPVWLHYWYVGKTTTVPSLYDADTNAAELFVNVVMFCLPVSILRVQRLRRSLHYLAKDNIELMVYKFGLYIVTYIFAAVMQFTEVNSDYHCTVQPASTTRGRASRRRSAFSCRRFGRRACST
jgi:hypothetical protein